MFDHRRSGLCLKKISDVSAILQSIKELLLRICKRIDDYEKSRMNIRNNDLIFVSFKSDGVYLNDIKFIDKKASQQYSLFQALLRKQFESRLNQTENIGLTWMQLAAEIDLKKQTKFKNQNVQTSEQHIRQLISQLRKKAKDVTKKHDLVIICDAVKGRYVVNAKIVLF